MQGVVEKGFRELRGYRVGGGSVAGKGRRDGATGPHLGLWGLMCRLWKKLQVFLLQSTWSDVLFKVNIVMGEMSSLPLPLGLCPMVAQFNHARWAKEPWSLPPLSPAHTVLLCVLVCFFAFSPFLHLFYIQSERGAHSQNKECSLAQRQGRSQVKLRLPSHPKAGRPLEASPKPVGSEASSLWHAWSSRSSRSTHTLASLTLDSES